MKKQHPIEQVDSILSAEERESILDTFLRSNPRQRGITVPDLLDLLRERDSFCSVIEWFARLSDHEAAPYCILVAALYHGVDVEWVQVEAFLDRVKAKEFAETSALSV